MPAFKVAPIGTCRLHTPLRRGASRFGYRLQLAHNYGFTHTSAEALQQLRYMLGEIKFPEDVARLICRPAPAKAQSKTAHALADLYLVEISSAKLLSCRDYFVQLNYVYRYFADFFSDKDRSRWFWALATDARAPELAERLAADPAFNRLDAVDKALLADLRLSEVTADVLERDITGLVERLGAERLVLVTHVDANLPDGSVIAARSRLIDEVQACADRLGLRCFDPTPLMHLVGQSQAMERFGLDLTHFTDAFSDRLCAALHAAFMSAEDSGGAVESGRADTDTHGARQLAGELESIWLNGDFRAASRDLRSALAADPAAPELRQLLGRMQFELGDYQAAGANLEAARDVLGSDENSDRMLMLISYELGNYDQALRFGEALLGDEIESAEILRTCAASAAAAGRSETAINYWQRLFWLDGSADAASAVLALLAGGGDSEGARIWAEKVLAVLPMHADSLVRLWHDCVARRDRGRMLETVSRYEALPLDQLLSLAEAAADAVPLASAILLARVRSSDGVTEISRPRVAEWTERATAALADGRTVEALEPLQAAALLQPGTMAIVRAHRAVVRALRIDARAAILAKDFARVAVIGEEALATGVEFKELDAFLGKAYLDMGRAEAALHHLRRAAAADPNPAAAWLQLARSALRLDHHAEAIDACLAAMRVPGSDVVEAASKLLAALASRALKAIRTLTAAGDYEPAWTLAAAMLAYRPGDGAVVREKTLILRAMRDAISGVDKADGAQRLELARRLLALDPGDAFALRIAAIETMRAHEFEASLRHWVELKTSGSDLARLDINIEKCRLWISRQRRRAHPPLAAAA